MTINEYIEIRMIELNKMKSWWEECQQSAPDDFPKHLDEGDWFEQELTYNECILHKDSICWWVK